MIELKKNLTIEEIKIRMCGNKKKYDSETHARWVINSIQKEGIKNFSLIMNIYECKFCHKWHIGHKNNKGKPEYDKKLSILLHEVSDLLENMK